ncbi:hypothetical protein Scep_029428 [Stephania cephalantha]|uniref:CCHC-type domain-containing protein n=1 Tax=Stephania cephalantha TaxID=152367 RepID=A0AAP0E179_9MAGN
MARRVRETGRVSIKCTNRDRGLVMHRDKDRDNMFQLDRDFNVLVWECGQPGHFTSRCSQEQAGTTKPGADSCYCHVRSDYYPS